MKKNIDFIANCDLFFNKWHFFSCFSKFNLKLHQQLKSKSGCIFVYLTQSLFVQTHINLTLESDAKKPHFVCTARKRK